MRKSLFAILLLSLAGCTSGSDQEMGYLDPDATGCRVVDNVMICMGDTDEFAPRYLASGRYIPANRVGGTKIAYDTPNNNDLALETQRTLLHVVGAPEKRYNYYVWTGDKTFDDEPDLIIEDTNAFILQSE